MSVFKRIQRIVAAETNQILDWFEDRHTNQAADLEKTVAEAQAAAEEARARCTDLREKEALCAARQELVDRNIVDALARGAHETAQQLVREKIEREERLEQLRTEVRAARAELAAAERVLARAGARYDAVRAKEADDTPPASEPIEV